MSIVVYQDVATPIVPVEGIAGRIREALGASLRQMRYIIPAGTDGNFAGLYQDAAGTTPVTAVGQPVGLAMDRRFGLGVGPELLRNGDFSEGAAYWDLDPDVSVTEGVLSSSKPGAGVVAAQAVAPTAGATYRISFRYTNPENLTLVPRFVGWTQKSGPNVPAGEGIYIAYVAAAEGNNVFRFNASSSGFTGTLRDISVREVPGHHASQPTTPARPTLLGNPLRLSFDGVDDALATTFPDLGSNVTIARSIPGTGAQILTGQTISGEWIDNVTSCATLVIDRALTPDEAALVTAFLNQQAGV